MFRVCIGGTCTCGFKNDSLRVIFSDGNRCRFSLMVRCGAALLYSGRFYMEKTALLSQGHLSIVVSEGFVWFLPSVITHWERRQDIGVVLDVLILPFSFSKDIKKKNVVSNFIMASGRVSLVGVRFWLVTYSAAIFDLTSKNVGIWNIPLNPISWKGVWRTLRCNQSFAKLLSEGNSPLITGHLLVT